MSSGYTKDQLEFLASNPGRALPGDIVALARFAQAADAAAAVVAACAHDDNRSWSIASGHAHWCPSCGAIRMPRAGWRPPSEVDSARLASMIRVLCREGFDDADKLASLTLALDGSAQIIKELRSTVATLEEELAKEKRQAARTRRVFVLVLETMTRDLGNLFREAMATFLAGEKAKGDELCAGAKVEPGWPKEHTL